MHSFWQKLWRSFWHRFWHSIWHRFWRSIWHKFRHSFCQKFRHSTWHRFWRSIWHEFRRSICHKFRHSFWHKFWHSTWHRFWRSIWHEFWHSFWHRFWQVELPSGAGGWGPVGNTAFGSLRLRSGREHCHRELAVEVTAIGSWRLRSGGEHGHRELAVGVRWGTLPGGGEGGGWGGGEGVADIKSNNPHLTGGEKTWSGLPAALASIARSRSSLPRVIGDRQKSAELNDTQKKTQSSKQWNRILTRSCKNAKLIWRENIPNSIFKSSKWPMFGWNYAEFMDMNLSKICDSWHKTAPICTVFYLPFAATTVSSRQGVCWAYTSCRTLSCSWWP